MSAGRIPPLLAWALLGSAVAGAAYFIGKRLREGDFEREQEFDVDRRRLARGLAVLVALGFLVIAVTEPDEDRP